MIISQIQSTWSNIQQDLFFFGQEYMHFNQRQNYWNDHPIPHQRWKSATFCLEVLPPVLPESKACLQQGTKMVLKYFSPQTAYQLQEKNETVIIQWRNGVASQLGDQINITHEGQMDRVCPKHTLRRTHIITWAVSQITAQNLKPIMRKCQINTK